MIGVEQLRSFSLAACSWRRGSNSYVEIRQLERVEQVGADQDG